MFIAQTSSNRYVWMTSC